MIKYLCRQFPDLNADLDSKIQMRMKKPFPLLVFFFWQHILLLTKYINFVSSLCRELSQCKFVNCLWCKRLNNKNHFAICWQTTPLQLYPPLGWRDNFRKNIDIGKQNYRSMIPILLFKRNKEIIYMKEISYVSSKNDGWHQQISKFSRKVDNGCHL